MRRGLQIVLAALGVVAVAFGVAGVLGGTAMVRGAGPVAPSVDSEFRFFASWYLGAGMVLLGTVRRVEASGTTIRSLCALLLVAAGGRALSMATVGAPHPLYTTLMAVEIVIPAVIIPWQTAVARRDPLRTPSAPGRLEDVASEMLADDLRTEPAQPKGPPPIRTDPARGRDE